MTKRLARMGLLTALALILFIVEAQIPLPIPIPGIKLGLANIVTVYAMFCLGPGDTFLIFLGRVILGSVFSGSLLTFLYSFTGGLFCFLIMAGIRKVLTLRQIWVCSILGALAHNLGQILTAIWVSRTPSLLVYLPVLMIAGMVTGLFTGLCAQTAVLHLKKIRKDR